MTHILDSTAPFEFFAKNGYYSVDDTIAVHSGPACQEASRTGLPVKWNFNEEVYNKFNWQSRLNLPLTELYRIRAQQLRDKYDYLMLWFSGGADSTTMIESFVNNGIHLDEVIVGWPRSQTAGKYNPNRNPDPSNFSSEWDYSIAPKLEWLSKNYPKVRITVVDQLLQLDSVEDYADTFTIVEKHGYAQINRQRLLDNELKQRYCTYKNIACLMGSAPPIVTILDNKWLAINFNSSIAAGAMGKSDYLIDGTPRNVEYFYWTPDLPELVREQAHVILDHLNSNTRDKMLFLNFGTEKGYFHNDNAIRDERIREDRRNLIKQLVYPNWNNTTFQVNKPTDMITTSYYNWFHLNPESKSFTQGWKSHMQSQFSLIDTTWVKHANGMYNLNEFSSRFYPIGRLTG